MGDSRLEGGYAVEQRVTDVFFAALRSELTDVPADPSLVSGMTAEDTEALCALSDAHDLSHIVYRSLSKAGLWHAEDPHTAAMVHALQAAQYRYVLMESALSALRGALSCAGVDFIPLKGSVLRRLYPRPYLRVSCDIDLLVREEDIQSACRVLTEVLGYRRGDTSTHDISFYTAENIHIELHFSLTEEAAPHPSDGVLRRMFSYAVGEGREKALTPEAFYVYHVAHMAKHVMDGGCGVRPFLDLYVLRSVARDEALCRALLEEAQLLSFARVCERLTDTWLLGQPHDEATASLAAYILSGGVYGTRENSTKLLTARRGKVRYMFSKIFLPYKVLSVYYPVLRRHPYLFPVMQVVRWWRRLFTKDVSRMRATATCARAENKDGDFSLTVKRWGL